MKKIPANDIPHKMIISDRALKFTDTNANSINNKSL